MYPASMGRIAIVAVVMTKQQDDIIGKITAQNSLADDTTEEKKKFLN